MHFRRCGDHCVFIKRIGFPVYQSSPGPEGCGIHRQDVIGASHQFQPCLDFVGFLCVLLSRQLNASLYFTQGHSGQIELGVINRFQPCKHGSVWTLPAQFGNHVRVKQVSVRHGNCATSRRLARPRAGTIMSARVWSESSSCFKEGRAADCKRRHSCTGTSTAASAPRLVTICGPSRRQASRNSLNRAFAS